MAFVALRKHNLEEFVALLSNLGQDVDSALRDALHLTVVPHLRAYIARSLEVRGVTLSSEEVAAAAFADNLAKAYPSSTMVPCFASNTTTVAAAAAQSALCSVAAVPALLGKMVEGAAVSHLQSIRLLSLNDRLQMGTVSDVDAEFFSSVDETPDSALHVDDCGYVFGLGRVVVLSCLRQLAVAGVSPSTLPLRHELTCIRSLALPAQHASCSEVRTLWLSAGSSRAGVVVG